jgi:large subunit ribosomal protein L20
MTRVKRSIRTRARHKKIIKQAKGYFGKKSIVFRIANQQVMKSLNYAYRDRRAKKRDFRRLWIVRINAAARINGMSYSRLMSGLRTAVIALDRKVLADIAVHDAVAFAALCQRVQSV